MLLFGHTGITLGAAALLAGALERKGVLRNGVRQTAHSGDRTTWFTALGSAIDIRLLFIGALLPDIIDKPVGQFFFRETFSYGRIFAHTLVFLILITLAGVYLYRHCRNTWLLVLAFGTFTHLVLDQMWNVPETLLWPFLGFTFGRIDLADWMPGMLHALITDPSVYIPEIVGLAILLWFGLMLLCQSGLLAFIRHGRGG